VPATAGNSFYGLAIGFTAFAQAVLNAACRVSARKTLVFVPICRNFDKDAPLQNTARF
jgi:hypothetical protein